MATSLNVGASDVAAAYGNMNKELTKDNTKLFAEAVMPKLKPLFSEWEDRSVAAADGVRSASGRAGIRSGIGRGVRARRYGPSPACGGR